MRLVKILDVNERVEVVISHNIWARSKENERSLMGVIYPTLEFRMHTITMEGVHKPVS